jgi:hypothetical protein
LAEILYHPDLDASISVAPQAVAQHRRSGWIPISELDSDEHPDHRPPPEVVSAPLESDPEQREL